MTNPVDGVSATKRVERKMRGAVFRKVKKRNSIRSKPGAITQISRKKPGPSLPARHNGLVPEVGNDRMDLF